MAVAGDKGVRAGIVAARSDDEFDLLPSSFESRKNDPDNPEEPQFFEGYWPRRWQQFQRKIAESMEEEQAFGHFFLWMPVWMGAGAILWFTSEGEPSLMALAASFVVLASVLRLVSPWRPVLRRFLAIILMMIAGGLLAALETRRMSTVILDTPVTSTITGIVTGREADANGKWRYEVRLTSTDDPVLRRAPVMVKLTASRGDPVDLGGTITGRARLSPPSGPALPGLNDFSFDAYFSRTGAVGFFYGSPRQIADASTAIDSASVTHMLATLRSSISQRIRSVLPGDTGAFASSMVTDDRRAISDETTEALRLAGLAHIVAISGLNMALAAGIFFVGLRLLMALSSELAQRLPVKKIAAAGALVTVTGYYMISGFAVSAERAYIMMAVILIAAVFGKPSISLRNVAISALVILILSPSAALSPGFQMSFAATLALVAGYGAWQRQQRGEPVVAGLTDHFLVRPAWQFMRGVFLTSLIGGLSTALYSAEHFHRLAAWGLPANLLAMPIISFIVMPTGLLALAMMPFGLDWLPLKVMGYGLDAVIAIAKWAASLGGDMVTGRIPVWFFIGMTAALLVLAIMRSRLRYIGGALALMLCLSVALMPGYRTPDLVIHEDGSLLGLIVDRKIATSRKRPPEFIYDQWQTALQIEGRVDPMAEQGQAKQQRDRRTREEIADLANRMKTDIERALEARFLCRKNLWCVASLRSQKIVLVEEAALVGPACDAANIVVTPARMRWHECRSGARLFDAASLRRTGSLEIYLRNAGGGTELEIMPSFVTLNRPWQRHRLYDWRSDSFVE